VNLAVALTILPSVTALSGLPSGLPGPNFLDKFAPQQVDSVEPLKL
jgi:hypothetical protein